MLIESIAPKLISDGGVLSMCLLSLLLAFIFFAAWKAPGWVKELGQCGLVLGFVFSAVSLWQVLNLCEKYGDISFNIACGGLKCIVIPVTYGAIIFLVSLVISIIQKPRHK